MTGYVAAILFFFARGLRPKPRTAAFVLLGTGVLSSAVLLRVDHAAVRYTIGLLLVIFLMHMWDLHLDPLRSRRLRLRDYAVFLADYAWSVARVPDGYGVHLSGKQRALDAARYTAGFCLVTAVAVGV